MPHRQRSRSRGQRDHHRSPRRPYNESEHGNHGRQGSAYRRSSYASDRGRSDRYSARRARDQRHHSRSRTHKSPARGRSDRDRDRSHSRGRYFSPGHHRHERISSSERHQSLTYNRRSDCHDSRDRHSRSRRRYHGRLDRDHSRSNSRSRTAGSTRYEHRRSRERHSPSRRIHDRNAIENTPLRQDEYIQDSRTYDAADVPRRTGQTLAAPVLSPSAATPVVQTPLNNGAFDSESWRSNGDGRQNSMSAPGRTTVGLSNHRSDDEGRLAAGVVALHAATSTAVRLDQSILSGVRRHIVLGRTELEEANDGMSSVRALVVNYK